MLEIIGLFDRHQLFTINVLIGQFYGIHYTSNSLWKKSGNGERSSLFKRGGLYTGYTSNNACAFRVVLFATHLKNLQKVFGVSNLSGRL